MNTNTLQQIQSYSADYDGYSVDATILSNGGTYHVVKVVTIFDDGHSEYEARKFFSRTKAQTFAQYQTRQDR